MNNRVQSVRQRASYGRRCALNTS